MQSYNIAYNIEMIQVRGPLSNSKPCISGRALHSVLHRKGEEAKHLTKM